MSLIDSSETVEEGMRKGVVAGIGIIAFLGALLMMQLTTPHMVGPLGVLAFFILIYIGCSSAAYLLLSSTFVFLGRIVTKNKWQAVLSDVTAKKMYYYSSFIALAPVILLGMQSVGAVKLIDAALLVAFQILGCFYISKRF